MQALPKSILNENTDTHIKREEESSKMKTSIVGFHDTLNQDVAHNTGNNDHDDLDPNLTGNMRPSISPRYTNSPSKNYSP